MLNFLLTTIKWLLLIGFSTGLSKATDYLPDYEATYQITRGGKPTAKQQTTVVRQTDNSFKLQDVTEGTHGLASLAGFERNEVSIFKVGNLQMLAINHEMKQKVAFSRKSFKYQTDQHSDLISGKSKKNTFELNTKIKPISSHMLPWWLSLMVCEGQTVITIPVLKSQNIKTYHFKVTDNSNGLIRVDRIYDANTNKSTQIWLDSQMNCFPVKTRHLEADEPVIETTLEQHTFSANSSTFKPENKKQDASS